MEKLNGLKTAEKFKRQTVRQAERVKCGKWFLPVLFVAWGYLWTWFIVDGTFRITAQIVLMVVLALVFYKGSILISLLLG